jgi:CubicO group peptidase (beta-lactamase class C family)
MKPALLILAAAALLAGCGSDTRPQSQAGRKAACDPGLERALRLWARAGFSGSIAISRRGELACVAAYGTADKETGWANTPKAVFSIGSITKAFTAAAVLELADAGKLSLADRAGDLLSELRGPAADATVEQLLLHTSGLKGSHGGDREAMTQEQAIAAIGDLERAFQPGSRFLYTNAGYTLLALIVERASGTAFRDYLASHVLRLPGGRVAGGFWDGQPAARGPRSLGYLEDGSAGERGDFAGPYWAVEGNGGLAMTMGDLADWTHALFTGKVVSRDVAEAIAKPGVRSGPGKWETPGWVAYDKSVYGQPVFASAGGGGDIGHNAIVAWLPKSETAIAVASNTPEISAEQLLEEIGPALAAGDPLPAPKGKRGKIDPAELRTHAGTYELSEGGAFRVIARGDRLVVSAEGAGAVKALFPLAAGFSPKDVAEHERLVLALLGGGSKEGVKERKALESSFGAIGDVQLSGSIVDHGELHTYVTVTAGRKSVRLWYALNDEGGVKAAQGPADAPTAVLFGAGQETFRPDDPTGAAPPVNVTFSGRRMTVAGPQGHVSARRR